MFLCVELSPTSSKCSSHPSPAPWLSGSLSSFFSLREGGLYTLSQQSRARGRAQSFTSVHPIQLCAHPSSLALSRSYFFFCVLRHKIDSLAATDGRDGERRRERRRHGRPCFRHLGIIPLCFSPLLSSPLFCSAPSAVPPPPAAV